MVPNKLKIWRGIVDHRLSELEAAFKNQNNKPLNTEDKSEQVVRSRPLERSAPRRAIALKTSLKYLGVAVTLVATPLGIVTGYLSLVPKVTVIQTESLNPRDPFSAQFIISNDGPLRINDMRAQCNFANVQYQNPE